MIFYRLSRQSVFYEQVMHFNHEEYSFIRQELCINIQTSTVTPVPGHDEM